MAYKIKISRRAQNEIEKAIDFYSENSVDAPLNFIIYLKEAYNKLEKNPFYRLRYKNVRAIKIKKFPYHLYFIIREETKFIFVLSCFHGVRSPRRRP